MRLNALRLLLVAALLVRLAVPAGWMPDVANGRIGLTLCAGAGPMPAMAMAPHDRHKPGAPGHDGSAHSCLFAAATAAVLAAPPFAVLPLPPVALVSTPQQRLAVAIGHGLAAPPPPATGPPLLV